MKDTEADLRAELEDSRHYQEQARDTSCAVSELQQQLSATEALCMKLCGDVTDAETDKGSIEQLLTKAQQDLETSSPNANREKSDTQAKLLEATQAKDTKQNELTQRKQGMDTLQNKLDSTTCANTNLVGRLKSLEEENYKLADVNAAHVMMIQTLNEHLSALQLQQQERKELQKQLTKITGERDAANSL